MLHRAPLGARVGLLGLALLAPACASRGAAPPQTPTTAHAATTPSTSVATPTPAPASAAPPAPATAATNDEPAAPAPTAAPADPPAAAPAAAAGSPAPQAPAPVTVNIADELPFLANGTTKHEAKHTKSARPKKLPPGTTGQRSTHHGRKRESRPYHPDPGIIVDITNASAGVSAADVQKLARAKGYNPFRHCYEEGLRRNQKIGGKVSIELVLGADGAVTSAKKTASTVGDPSVDQCVVRETTHLSLARPDSGTPTVAMVVTLSPGDEYVAVPHSAPHAEKIRDALRSRWSGVEVCYQKGLEKSRDLGGRLELRFKAKSSGEILELAEGDTHFTDADVSKCIVGVFKAAKLPKLGKHEASFVYAIHLEAIPTPPSP
jgi:outer membrane biosynthesis protein TonB